MENTITTRTLKYITASGIAAIMSVSAAAQTTVDDRALAEAGSTAEQWISYGRDQAETRFSPLTGINADNVAELGVVWTYDTGATRGHEATPLMWNGMLFATRPWGGVFALDAKTGEEVWHFDPGVDKGIGWKACCDVVNRGVALYEDKVYVGATDGRLIALDAMTGEPVWSVMTVDPDRPYTITGAPRIADGKVIIGNGGAELGVRGYVTAYDATTGEQDWRFWVVPGNPADGFENPDVEAAAETWNGNWWEAGGGGTVWDSIIYDPDARLVYVGTGNGSPWSHELRSDGEGDNLYLSSIVALDVETGRIEWHYQTTPGENWDYTAVQSLMLAELSIDGEMREVIMQAPKNGFFYVLDRHTGELLSAEPYAQVTWASGVDMETGRPIETPQARYDDAISFIMPGPGGAHNWNPMAYSPDTGLVYLPSIQESSFPYVQEAGFEFELGRWNIGVPLGSLAGIAERPDQDYGPGAGPEPRSTGALLAWDPVAGEPRWQIDYDIASSGGTLATAGNLVFQGTGDGRFMAFAADTGERLWEVDLGVGVMAAPMTYRIDDRQYVSVLVGWGGASALFGANFDGQYKPEGRLWTFALGGDQDVEPVRGQAYPALTAIDFDDDPDQLARGGDLYGQRCSMCHGRGAASGGPLADLRHSAPGVFDSYQAIVRQGAYTGMGMPNLGDVVSNEEVALIRNYVLSRRAAAMAPGTP